MAMVDLSGTVLDIAGNIGDPIYDGAQQHVDGLRYLIDLASNLPHGATIFDVGANIGLSAIAMAVSAPDCDVVCFEPSPINFRFLEKNVSQLGSTKIKIHNAAASNKRSTSRATSRR